MKPLIILVLFFNIGLVTTSYHTESYDEKSCEAVLNNTTAQDEYGGYVLGNCLEVDQ